MTLKVYISRDKITGKEKTFEHSFERYAALQAAKTLWRHYGQSTTHFALVANIDVPPIDLAIISRDGLGIIDLKDYSSPVGGKDNTPWYVLDRHNKPHIKLSSGKHLNPFEQVKNYRRRTYGRLRGFAQDNVRLMPRWIIDDRFGIQATVMFTAQKFDLSRIIIDPAVGRPWFSLQWLDQVADWTYSLEFGRRHRLTESQIDLLATKFFKTQQWTEIEGHLESNDPYARLWIVADDKETSPLTLDQDEMVIGRSPEASLMLDSKSFPLVSRQHAVIRHTADKVIITDLESKHGTWVNDARVSSATGTTLKNGDRIILGKNTPDDQRIPKGSCGLTFRPIGRRVDVTASEVIS